MRYPKFLKDGGRIGFIAPSFGCTIEPYASCFNEALRRLQQRGYKTVEGPNCRKDDGAGKSTDPKSCAAEINEFFEKPYSDVLISCGGGETMCEDLSYVDFAGIAEAAPKWFMGYSDNTNLTFTLPTICDTAAIYGPCAATFGQRPWHPAVEDALAAIRGEKLTLSNYDKWEKDQLKADDNPFVPYNVTEPFDMKIEGSAKGQNKAEFSGRLIGGCLDVLTCLCGTRFDHVKEFVVRYAGDGIVWFLESCELRPAGIRRALWQLENAGWFENVKGFLIGRPYCGPCDDFGLTEITAVTGILEKYDVPILMNLDIGHLPPMMPIISGSFGEIRAEGNKLTIDQKLI